jgi:hypothetical protein
VLEEEVEAKRILMRLEKALNTQRTTISEIA